MDTFAHGTTSQRVLDGAFEYRVGQHVDVDDIPFDKRLISDRAR
jgi:hypothetical protein